MAQLFDIKKVTIGPRNLDAEVEVAPSAPLMTSDDPEGTERVLELIPELSDHLCLGDSSSSFGDVIGDTELAHLLEHVTVELLARTDLAGDVSSGQTTGLADRLYKISLSCPDDVLVAGALSSAAWILQWAYAGGGDLRPDVDAIASGLVSLVESLSVEGGPESTSAEQVATEPDSVEEVAGPVEETPSEPAEEPAEEPEEVDATEQPASDDQGVEQAVEPAAETAEEPEAAPAEEPEPPARDAWDLGDVPRPHLVR